MKASLFSVGSFSRQRKLSGLIKRLTSGNIEEQTNLADLGKYILLKKLKYDNESQILRISQFLNSFPRNYKLISDTKIKEIENKKQILEELISVLKLHPENKSKKEILAIKNFLVSVGLHKLFEFPNYNEKMIEKLIAYCCFNLKMKFYKRNSIIYNRNDTFDKFFILTSGEVGKYKTISKTVKMSGFRYFQYIYNLYFKKDMYLLKLVLEKNFKLFPIDEKMMENLNINLAKYIINMQQNQKGNLDYFNSQEDILKSCYINPKTFLYDPNENIEQKSVYELLSRKRDENNIIIYEYLQTELYIDKQILETFNNNDIIELYKIRNHNISYQYNKTQKRNFTLKTILDSYLCYLDLQEYIYYFIGEYKSYMHEQALFLINNFIFKKIVKHFENNYFHFFEFEEVPANNYLFKENDPVEYIYLLKEGIVELSINKNIFKIYDIINQLSSNIDNMNNETYKGTKEVENKIKEIHSEKGIMELDQIKKFNENKNEKIAILEQNEIIGIECLYCGINYFYNAKLGNKKARFYKIRKDKLLKILDMEQRSGINVDYQKEVQRKINFFLLRLINLTKVKINCIKTKKVHNLVNLYNQMNTGRNYRKVKLYLTYKKTKLRLKSSSNHNENQNNMDISISNHNNIFELTNPENNISNQNSRNKANRKSIKQITNIKNNLVPKRNNTDINLNINNEKEILKNNKSVPKLKTDNQAYLSLKKEEIILNRLNKQLSNDHLFFTKIKTFNNFNDLKLIENIKTRRNNNSYNDHIYDNWKTFHLNININQASYRKKLNKINWYKNIDKFPFNTEDSKENISNKISYGIQVNKEKVTFIQDKLFSKNNCLYLNS